MEQFWYTDNLKGRGLSVLRSSEKLTGDFLAAIDAYCGYLRSSDGSNADGQRYNRSFAGEGMPVLMNSAYIGKEVTTQRNGNFLTHAVLSKVSLNGYAVDYFLKEGFFCRALSENEAKEMNPKPLGEIGDSGVRATETEKREDLEWAAETVNRNLSFYRNLLQATLFTLKNGGHIRLFGFGDAKGDGQPIRIVHALTHLFPVNLANRITFNTRANYYEPPRDRYLRVIVNENERRATFGSVEILQFYDATRTACGTEGCNYFFYRNNEAAGVRFARFLPFVEKLLPEEGTSAALIETFHDWFYQHDLDMEENTPKAIAAITAEDWSLSLAIPMETEAKGKARPRRPRKEKREGGEGKKRKTVIIISILLALLLLVAAGLTAFFLINRTRSPDPDVDPPPQGQTDPPSVTDQYFTVVYPDGEAARFRIGDEIVLNLPDARLGYDFLGYRDGQGKAVTDASGAVRSDYIPTAGIRLELSAAWQARENKLTVSYGTQTRDFTCATDAAITFPADLFPALLAAYPHRRITGFALDSAEGAKICTVSGTAVTWVEGYGVFSEEKYKSRLESGTPLVLVPLTEYQSYPVRFYDYVTKAALGSAETPYDQPITVDVSYSADYFGGKYSLYLKKGTEFVKVYNEDGNGRWTEGYDRVSGYDEVLDADGEIALYVAGNVRLRIGNSSMDIELGSDIFSLCEGLTKNEKIHAVNFIYVGQTRSESADSNDAFWQIIREQGMENAISVTPAYKATFTFGYNRDRTELAQGGDTLKRSVAYLYFDGGYRYEGAEMSEINAALKDKAPDIQTRNGVVCADLILNLWMPAPEETDASYAVFEGYVLEKGARMTSYFNVDGEYGGGPVALVEGGSERCLYAVYDPKEVTVSFEGVSAHDTTVYGGKIDWAELNSRISGYQPQWGTYLIRWSAADGKMKESGEDSVTSDFLDVYAKNDSGNGAPSIEFTPQLGNYTFKFSISYGGHTDSSQSLTVGGTVHFDKAAIEAYYPVARYSTLWNQGWTLGGKNFTPAETMTVNEGTFGEYVNFGNAANHVITLIATKGAPTPRTYTIVTDSYAYALTERFGRTSTEALSQRIGISAAGSITYQGSMSLGVCEPFELGAWDRTQYVFEGWFVGDTRITDADGVIKNFDALYQLAQNDVITVRAVFKEV